MKEPTLTGWKGRVSGVFCASRINEQYLLTASLCASPFLPWSFLWTFNRVNDQVSIIAKSLHPDDRHHTAKPLPDDSSAFRPSINIIVVQLNWRKSVIVVDELSR